MAQRKTTNRAKPSKPARTGPNRPARKRETPSGAASTSSSRAVSGPATPRLLSRGNPQIPKADGDAPVQAYIAAMPGWKQDVGRRLDALIVRTLPNPPGVRKAVRWNTPFYGVGGLDSADAGPAHDTGWFLAFHCITKNVKVTFFAGTSLRPLPPVESKVKGVRYVHIHENDWGTTLDEALLESWICQAAALPGMDCF